MKTPFSLLKLVAATLAVTSVLCVPTTTRADRIALYLDSSQSYLDASGNAFGLNFGPQATGAMRANYSGIIAADYNAGVFTFTGGSLITALNNPAGPFSSDPYPGGPWAGNYGVTAGPTFVPTFNFVIVNGVYTGMSLDLTAGTAQDGIAPSGVTDQWTGGTLILGCGYRYRADRSLDACWWWCLFDGRYRRGGYIRHLGFFRRDDADPANYLSHDWVEPGRGLDGPACGGHSRAHNAGAGWYRPFDARRSAILSPPAHPLSGVHVLLR